MALETLLSALETQYCDQLEFKKAKIKNTIFKEEVIKLHLKRPVYLDL